MDSVPTASKLSTGLSTRARAFWRRHIALLIAALLHIVILGFVLPSMVNRAEPPPADSVDVSMTPPPKQLPKPKPKPVIPKPAPRPAEKNTSTARPNKPAPRLTRLAPPPIHLKLPPPLEPKPPMVLPATTGPTAAGAAPNSGGGGGSGNGNGNGAQDGIDYLGRLKAYIDSRKSDDGHRNARDTDVVLLLDPDGVLTGIRVVSSSGDPRVDDDIVNQLKHMSPFPKPPAILFSPSKPILAVADKWIFTR